MGVCRSVECKMVVWVNVGVWSVCEMAVWVYVAVWIVCEREKKNREKKENFSLPNIWKDFLYIL